MRDQFYTRKRNEEVFYDAFITFYSVLCDVGHMVKNHSGD